MSLISGPDGINISTLLFRNIPFKIPQKTDSQSWPGTGQPEGAYAAKQLPSRLERLCNPPFPMVK
ncbi:MAG TPA: hypothetical protein DCZ40_00955 [Lachnospiraceae bacterium]|nr:hypothetical protein [Lachnospiraceae bacterium]